MEQLGVINYLTYLVGTILIILLPGPNSVYVLALAAQKGVKAGWLGALGIFVGDAILMLLTALGAASLLKSSPMLFMIIKYAGAIYLAYIGCQLIYGAWKNWSAQSLEQMAEQPMTQRLSRTHPFRKALIISVLNPKALLFFFSFFLQFVDPAYPYPVLPFLILAVTLQCLSVIYLASLIYAGAHIAESFRRRRRLSALSGGGVGLVFVTFAGKLALSSLA